MHYEAFTWANIAATPAAFYVGLGGRYGLDVSATWGGGSVILNKLSQDGSTWIAVLPATFTTNGSQLVDLPVGAYQLAITTATAVYACLSRIPLSE